MLEIILNPKFLIPFSVIVSLSMLAGIFIGLIYVGHYLGLY